MSLLEDVFLEDEAGEAQELERVIEGDDDERPRTPDSNENSEKEDEAEEDKRVVDHTAKAKRVVKNPRFILNPARLTGPRGIQVIPEHFKDFKFKGKGHELEDLDFILKKLEHWAYRLYPKFKFDDCLKKIETLGKKRPVMVHLHKIRTDQFLSEETVQQQDSSGDEAAPAPQEDEFDRLLQQQIELARATPTPSSVRKEMTTPMSSHRSSLMVPKAASSPSISDEQKERMMKNRQLAEERRLAKLRQLNTTTHSGNTTNQIPETIDEENIRADVNNTIVINDDVDKDVVVVRKQNRSNVIDSDSSDGETDVVAVNESISVQVHNEIQNTEDDSDKYNEEQATVIDSDDNIISTDVSIEIIKSNGNKDNVTNDNDKEKESMEALVVESGENAIPTNVSIDINKSNEGKELVMEDKPNDTDMIETNLPNHKTCDDTLNSEVKENVSNDNIVIESHKASIEESKVPENQENGTVTEELMDIDFSDDF